MEKNHITNEAPCACCKVRPRRPGKSYCSQCRHETNKASETRRRALQLVHEAKTGQEKTARFERLVEWCRAENIKELTRRVKQEKKGNSYERSI